MQPWTEPSACKIAWATFWQTFRKFLNAPETISYSPGNISYSPGNTSYNPCPGVQLLLLTGCTKYHPADWVSPTIPLSSGFTGPAYGTGKNLVIFYVIYFYFIARKCCSKRASSHTLLLRWASPLMPYGQNHHTISLPKFCKSFSNSSRFAVYSL